MPSPTAVSDALARQQRIITVATPWDSEPAADLMGPALPAPSEAELLLTPKGFVARFAACWCWRGGAGDG